MRVCVGLCVGWGVCVWQVLLRRAQGLPAVLCTNWNCAVEVSTSCLVPPSCVVYGPELYSGGL
jgi:hypothetical protein